MTKIGILTFHRSHNYGAVLQAYALFTTLRQLGYDVSFIDYWPAYREGHYSLFRKDSTLWTKKLFNPSYAKRTINSTLNLPARWQKHSRFNHFIIHKLQMEGTAYLEGKDTPDRYDVIICGSDQIWRPNFRGVKGFDAVYFAKYPVNKNVRKVSYAASMGDKDLDDLTKEALFRLLQNLDYVSVREDSLLDLIKPLTKTYPVQVLDPAFLLSATQWRTLIKTKAPKKKYLLFYQLRPNAEAAALARKIARDRGLVVIEIRGIDRDINPFASRGLQLSAGPVEFVSLVAHADYVVSTSYHGIVFSIIFQKPFAALGFHGNGYRISSLLKTLEIDQALVNGTQGANTQAVDYSAVNVRLKALINDSVAFLHQSIEDKKSALTIEKANGAIENIPVFGG